MNHGFVQRGERAADRLGPARWALLAALLAVAVACGASGVLVWQHFTGSSLPGCGPASACAQIGNHVLGRVLIPPAARPVVGIEKWPVSFLGLAYFAGVLAALGLVVVGGGKRAAALRPVLWVGAVVSAGYVAAIVVIGKYCQYCLAAHAANFAAVLALEIGMMRSRSMKTASASASASAGARPVRRGGVVGAWLTAVLTASAVLLVLERGRVATAAERAAEELRQSQEAIAAKVKADAEKAAQAASAGAAAAVDAFGPGGFTGRWRMGPEAAQARIVVLSSYQCAQCKRIEGEAAALVKAHPGKVSLSALHFPLCKDCNDHVAGECPHANSCWGARAAEAAGILKGNDGFWQMHNWLFERSGNFNDKELIDGVRALGHDPDLFTKLMTSDGPNRSIAGDVALGVKLGLTGTPMVFVNGVELRGWESPNALPAAVQAVLAAGAPALTASMDRPPLAADKWVQDWREESVTAIPQERFIHALGAPDSPVTIVMFGDLQQDQTAEADRKIRGWVTAGRPVRYVYRHMPAHPQCNPKVARAFFPESCLAARAAEAAFILGGDATYWKMHDWLQGRTKDLSLVKIKEAASSLGLDAAKLEATIAGTDAALAVSEDVQASNQLGLSQLPSIFVNGRIVKQWHRTEHPIFDRVLDDAIAATSKKPGG